MNAYGTSVTRARTNKATLGWNAAGSPRLNMAICSFLSICRHGIARGPGVRSTLQPDHHRLLFSHSSSNEHQHRTRVIGEMEHKMEPHSTQPGPYFPHKKPRWLYLWRRGEVQPQVFRRQGAKKSRMVPLYVIGCANIKCLQSCPSEKRPAGTCEKGGADACVQLFHASQRFTDCSASACKAMRRAKKN